MRIAVTGRNGTGAVLRELARAGAPLVALDGQEEHFRLHGLVAEALAAAGATVKRVQTTNAPHSRWFMFMPC